MLGTPVADEVLRPEDGPLQRTLDLVCEETPETFGVGAEARVRKKLRDVGYEAFLRQIWKVIYIL